MNKLCSVVMAAVMLASASNAKAYDFASGQLFYNVLSETDGTVEVTQNESGTYSGDIIIPDVAAYNGKTYIVTRIGDSAFKQSDITSLRCGNNLTHLSAWSLSSCTKLKSLYISKSVTNIEADAAAGCSVLRNLVFEPGCKAVIGSRAFADCPKFVCLLLPTTVTYEAQAFSSSACAVEFVGDLKSLNNGVFANVFPAYVMLGTAKPPTIGKVKPFDSKAKYFSTLYVPRGSLAAYKADSYWGTFSEIYEKPLELAVNGSAERVISTNVNAALATRLTFDARQDDFSPSKLGVYTDDSDIVEIEYVSTDEDGSINYNITGLKDGIAKVSFLYYNTNGLTVTYICYVCVGQFAAVHDVTVDNAEPAAYGVYDLSGVKVADGMSKDAVNTLPRGFYILVSPQGSTKHIVR